MIYLLHNSLKSYKYFLFTVLIVDKFNLAIIMGRWVLSIQVDGSGWVESTQMPESGEAIRLGSSEARKLGSSEAGKLGSSEARKLGSWEAGKLGSSEAGKLGSSEARKLGSYKAGRLES
jgi:hypothetical protein